MRLKRIFDIVFSICALIGTAPIMLVIALLIKLDSPGPIFFRQTRKGKFGKGFRIIKFRTMMHDHIPKDPLDYVHKGDPRITDIGHFLRDSSLDELPQFINVLLGNMSVVGPRPHTLQQALHYLNTMPEYAERFLMKPGITGLVQVSDLRSCAETEAEQRARLQLDIQYMQNWSLWLDIKIIFKTVWTMVRRYNVHRLEFPTCNPE